MSNSMIVTGASRGIGAAVARQAAAAGWSVCVNFTRNAEAADDVVAACAAAGSRAVAVQANVAQEADVIALFDQAEEALGPVTCLVNNAGILHKISRFDTYSVERIREVVDVNVVGALLCAREAVRRMSTRLGGGGGSIVNVGSAASYLGSPNEFIDYAATKGAMDTMTIGLAKEYADEGIRVNGVRPGLIDTEIHASAGLPDRVDRLKGNIPMRRGGTADEVADLVLYLASERASYVTGSLINVAGGR